MEKILEIKNLKMSYDNECVLDNISLDIAKNEFVTLLGPSGCGKTTLLQIIGGFISQDSGIIKFENKDITDVKPYEREINTVFQNYALFPHLNVFDNVAFGLKNKGVKKDIIKQEVDKVLKLVKLKGYEKRNVKMLSGGQKQRVAIARAVINKPKILLLDEPLSALDLKLRQDMQYELKDLQKKLGITFIFVTHDQEEALTMSDRIVVLNEGEILQIGSPEDIYNDPANYFVASFIGESNIFEAKVTKTGVRFLDVDIEIETEFELNSEVQVVVRPEDIYVCNKEKGMLTGIVDDITFKGVHYEIIVMINDVEIIIHSLKKVNVGEEIGIYIDPDIHVMEKTNESV